MRPETHFLVAKLFKIVIIALSVVAAGLFFLGCVYLPIRKVEGERESLTNYTRPERRLTINNSTNAFSNREEFRRTLLLRFGEFWPKNSFSICPESSPKMTSPATWDSYGAIGAGLTDWLVWRLLRGLKKNLGLLLPTLKRLP